uniref:Uncharacterized protein n=1 Tax=Tanacetum cinerariifolium TaxID=118510 RepID=A0A699KUG7_TANCI|nr:hypothetical protein [Tanacetum cinerariifolium]
MIRMRDDILEEYMPPQRKFVLIAPPPGCDVAESSAAATRPPRGLYDFVDTVKAGQGLIRNPGYDARTIIRAADRAEDVDYINRIDIRLEIDVVRGQRTAYETELHEVRQAYLSSKAWNRALLAQLDTLETHMSRMEWQRQSAEDLAVRQMTHIHRLELRLIWWRTPVVAVSYTFSFLAILYSLLSFLEEFKTDESAPTPRSLQTRVLFSQTHLRRAQKTVRLESPMSASMETAMIRMRDDILEEYMPPQRKFVLTAPPPGYDVAKSSAAAARPPRGLYDFVDTVKAGHGLIRNPGYDARTIIRATDRAEDVGYVRALKLLSIG